MVYTDFKLIQENGMYSVSISDVVVHTTNNLTFAEYVLECAKRYPLTIADAKAIQQGNFNYFKQVPNATEIIESNAE
jgi:hypothetical protein